MEERIVEEEYGRKIRLKKLPNGYVDAEEVGEDEGDGEEVLIELPEFEEDEALATMSVKEAQQYRKKKAEERAQAEEMHDALIKEGTEYLDKKEYEKALPVFEKAMSLMRSEEACFGYLRAYTSDFSDSDDLFEEYFEDGFTAFSSDYGEAVVSKIKETFGETVKKKTEEKRAELERKEADEEKKRQERETVLAPRYKKSGIKAILFSLPLLVGLIFTVIFALKINSRPDSYYAIRLAVAGAITFVGLFVSLAFTSRFVAVAKLRKQNGRLSYTKEGREILSLREEISFLEELGK